jgi:hypothetical protein
LLAALTATDHRLKNLQCASGSLKQVGKGWAQQVAGIHSLTSNSIDQAAIHTVHNAALQQYRQPARGIVAFSSWHQLPTAYTAAGPTRPALQYLSLHNRLLWAWPQKLQLCLANKQNIAGCPSHQSPEHACL